MLFIFRQLKEKIDNMPSLLELQLELDRVKQEVFNLKKDIEIMKKGKQRVETNNMNFDLLEKYSKSVENIDIVNT